MEKMRNLQNNKYLTSTIPVTSAKVSMTIQEEAYQRSLNLQKQRKDRYADILDAMDKERETRKNKESSTLQTTARRPQKKVKKISDIKSLRQASARHTNAKELMTIQPKSTITTMDEEAKSTVDQRFISIM